MKLLKEITLQQPQRRRCDMENKVGNICVSVEYENEDETIFVFMQDSTIAKLKEDLGLLGQIIRGELKETKELH